MEGGEGKNKGGHLYKWLEGGEGAIKFFSRKWWGGLQLNLKEFV
jgi:hypothetical protein